MIVIGIGEAGFKLSYEDGWHYLWRVSIWPENQRSVDLKDEKCDLILKALCLLICLFTGTQLTISIKIYFGSKP